MELAIYTGFVLAYFFLVLHFLGDWIGHVFVTSKPYYALLAVGLITAQGVVLERLTSLLLLVIRCLQAIIPMLRRLGRPHETIMRPEVPGSGLLVYRFAGPLFFFNAAYFLDRVLQIVKTADPPINFFLINAEAIIDMDMNAVEMLEELHAYLKQRNIILGFCDVKGHFREVLMNTHLTRRTGFNLYHSVAMVVQELNKGKPGEDNQSESETESEIPSS